MIALRKYFCLYVYGFNNKSVKVTFDDLVEVRRINEAHAGTTVNMFVSLPAILQQNAKVIMDHSGSFHKDYFQHAPKTGFDSKAEETPALFG